MFNFFPQRWVRWTVVRGIRPNRRVPVVPCFNCQEDTPLLRSTFVSVMGNIYCPACQVSCEAHVKIHMTGSGTMVPRKETCR